ncbi:MAG TPA: hypothetical protein VIY48_11515 [Candidatus Paceibacterota bacterium]
MAVVSLVSHFWDNPDGLRVEFPGDAGVVTRGGEVDFDGRHLTKAVIDLTALPTVASGNQQIILENSVIPAGAIVEQVDMLVEKAAVGVNATLDIGFVKPDRTTENDFNGLIAARATAAMTLGLLIETTSGGTAAGALLGTKIASDGILTANANTADFTAGKVEVRIYWSIPLAADV